MIAGAVVGYIVRVENKGTDQFTGVIGIDIQVPPVITGTTFDTSLGVYDRENKTLTFATPFQPGQIAEITVQGTLAAEYMSPTIQAITIISAPVGVLDPDLANNTSTTDFPVTREVDLEMVVTADPAVPSVGTTVALILSVTNHGPSTANGVTVDAMLPDGLVFDSSNGGDAYDDTTGIWTIGEMMAGELKELVILAQVQSSGSYALTATAEATETDGGTHSPTDTLTLTPDPAPVDTADLQVTLQASTLTPTIGDNVVLIFEFTNHGPATATNVQAAGNKPSGLEYVDHNPSGYNSGFDKWFLGNMPSGQTKTCTVTFKVLPTGDYTYNTSMFGNQNDSVPGNDTASVALTPAPPTGTFLFGINGHFTSQDIYRRNSFTDFEWSANFMGSIPGVNMSRFDVTVNADGTIPNTGGSVWAWYRIFATEEAPPESPIQNKYNWGMYWKQQAHGIQMMPMCYDRMNTEGLWDATLQECYDSGYTMMFGFATNYGQYFPYIELGNEWELFKKTRLKVNFGTPEEPVYRTGTHQSHWIVENVDRAVQYIKGMRDGIKAVNPNIQTVFNCAGWAPIYWMYRVINEANIDKVSWHWYSEMIDSMLNGNYPSSPYLPQPGSSYTTIADLSDDLFPGKPIWITEFGYRWAAGLGHTPAGNAENEQRQVDNFIQFMDQMRNDPRIECMMYHELLDMARIDPNSDEARYGMIAAYDYDNTGYENWTYKQLATELLNGTITI